MHHLHVTYSGAKGANVDIELALWITQEPEHSRVASSFGCMNSQRHTLRPRQCHPGRR